MISAKQRAKCELARIWRLPRGVTYPAALQRILLDAPLLAAGLLTLVMLPVAIVSSRIMWKKGIIKVVENEEKIEK